VVDLNLSGTTRLGTVSSPYYKINNSNVLNPNNLILNTSGSSPGGGIYLNATTGSTTQAIGSWRIIVDAQNRVAFQCYNASSVWATAFKINSI
jgi:hypothetical protein